MKGRPADLWQRELATRSLDHQIATLVEMGFRGVTIDRFGYGDLATELERQLSRLLKQSPLVSPDGRMSFFHFPSTFGCERSILRSGSAGQAVMHFD